MTKKITLSPSIDFSDSGNLPSLFFLSFFLSFFLFFPYFIYRCVIYLFPSCFLCIYLCIYIYIYIYIEICVCIYYHLTGFCVRAVLSHLRWPGQKRLGHPPTPSIGRRRKLTLPARPAIAKKKKKKKKKKFEFDNFIIFFFCFLHTKKNVSKNLNGLD